MSGQDDRLVKAQPLLDRVDDWREFLRAAEDEGEQEALRLRERTGRPLGDARFLAKLERLAGRVLRPRKPGPKKKAKG